MPTVTLNKEVLERMMGKKLPLDDLKDRISMIGTDLEKVEGNDIIVEVFPNRPDMLSEPGFARALSAFIGLKPGLREYAVTKSDYNVLVDKSVSQVRPFTSCAVIKGLKFDDEKIREIVQLQEKLHVTFGRNRKKLAIGIYPLEKIKMPITYTAMKPNEVKFRPLESIKEMTGKEILESHPTGKAYAHLLDGAKVLPVFVDAKGSILSMPPIINSHETGKVTESTKDVFIECSGFDFNVLNKCLSIIVTALADLGGEVYEMTLEYPDGKKKTPNLAPIEWKLDLKYVNKLLGMELKEQQVRELLGRMGIGYYNQKALVPSYRADILHQIDLAEDIAIAFGYENFEPEIPNVMTIGSEDPLEVFKDRIAAMLAGMGMLETINYNLTNEVINSTKMLSKEKLIELENSKTADRSALRSWLLPSLMSILSENTNKEYPQEIFEAGTAFSHDSGAETGVLESQKLAVAIASADSDFTRAKQVLDEIFSSLGKQCVVEKHEYPFFVPGRGARIFVDKQDVGFVGEIHPQVLENFGIQMPTAALELDIGKVYELVFQA